MVCESTSSFRKVPLNKLRFGHDPRNGADAVDDLRESFARGEQLQNIVVRPLPDTDEYEIIAGHRRVRSARALGWSDIDAKVIEADDMLAEQYALEENLLRKAPPDEATALARLHEIYEKTSTSTHGGDRRSGAFKETGSKRHRGALESATGRVARITGQSKRDVQRKVKIGKNATPKVKRALEEKKIPVNEADHLASLPSTEQDAKCDEVIRARTAAATVVPTPSLAEGAGATEQNAASVVEIMKALKIAAEMLEKLAPGDVPQGDQVELRNLAGVIVDLLQAFDTIGASCESSAAPVPSVQPPRLDRVPQQMFL